jgi:hypothetical protein
MSSSPIAVASGAVFNRELSLAKKGAGKPDLPNL